MSSVAPADSVSSVNKTKKTKPGKAERAARRATSSVSGVEADSTKAASFAAGGVSAPTPTPGRYPVVFSTGVGEPTRDREFAYGFKESMTSAMSFYDRYRQNPRYAEFRENSGVDDTSFLKQLLSVFYLGLAQQTVHAHVNMGFPQLDYSAVSTSELKLPSSMLAVLSQYGEFADANLGTRFVLGSYQDQVAQLVYTADRIWHSGSVGEARKVLSRSWLPTSATDRGTRLTIAEKLRAVLQPLGVDIPGTELEDSVLSGSEPGAWDSVKLNLGAPPAQGDPDRRDRFDFLFKAYADVGQFTTAFTTTEATNALAELELLWTDPSAGHLDWGFNVKSKFSVLADKWARLSAAYAKFFELGSSLATRANAVGSEAQFVSVKTVDVVTVVRTFVALSAPQLSLAACFPPTCVFSGGVVRNVVVTTPLSVTQRTTEWLQLDWRS